MMDWRCKFCGQVQPDDGAIRRHVERVLAKVPYCKTADSPKLAAKPKGEALIRTLASWADVAAAHLCLYEERAKFSSNVD